MRRILATLILLAPTTAHAAPITRYAWGTVTQNLTMGLNRPAPIAPHDFTVGETVEISFTYDPDGDTTWPDADVERVTIATGGGFTMGFGNPYFASMAFENGDISSLRMGRDPWDIWIRFPGGGESGTIRYERDLGVPSEGFIANIQHAPEPSGILMGVVGAGILIWWRRRNRT